MRVGGGNGPRSKGGASLLGGAIRRGIKCRGVGVLANNGVDASAVASSGSETSAAYLPAGTIVSHGFSSTGSGNEAPRLSGQATCGISGG